MIIEFWLDRSVPLIFLLLALVLGSTGLLALALFESRRTRGRAAIFDGAVAPVFTSISVLFALLTGFAATDAWERNRQATRAILAERDGIMALHELSLATVSDMSAIRGALAGYLDAVIETEWPSMREGEAAPAARDRLAGLLRELARPSISPDAGLAAHHSLLESWTKVRSARSDRLALAQQNSDYPKWWTILLLAILTQVGLALVHLGKPMVSALVIGLFTLGAVITLSLIAVKERPFDGPLATPPTALREALATIRRQTAPIPANAER